MIKVLIVEDEAGARNLLKIIVNWEEFHMKIMGEASNGREALFCMEKELPDLVVTDIRMPVMDGIELAEEIMKKYPSVKVIIITAYDEFKYAQQAIRAGAAGFILKPMKRQETWSIQTKRRCIPERCLRSIKRQRKALWTSWSRSGIIWRSITRKASFPCLWLRKNSF